MKTIGLSFLAAMLLMLSACSDAKKETSQNKDSLDVDEARLRDPKNYFKDCKRLFASAQYMDSVLYTQNELDKASANKAIKAFTDYAYYCANDSLSPIFLIKTAQVAIAINNITQAKVTLEKCIQDYSRFEGIPAAMFLLAQLYDEKEQLNNEAEARRLYEEIVTNYPTSPEAESAKGAIKFLGMTDKEIIRELKKQEKEAPKVTIQ